jgi:hypothetical protein
MRKRNGKDASVVSDGILLSGNMESMRDHKTWERANKDARRMAKKLTKMFELPSPRQIPMSPALTKMILAFAELLTEINQTQKKFNKVVQSSSVVRPSFRAPFVGQALPRRNRGDNKSKSK